MDFCPSKLCVGYGRRTCLICQCWFWFLKHHRLLVNTFVGRCHSWKSVCNRIIRKFFRRRLGEKRSLVITLTHEKFIHLMQICVGRPSHGQWLDLYTPDLSRTWLCVILGERAVLHQVFLDQGRLPRQPATRYPTAVERVIHFWREILSCL